MNERYLEDVQKRIRRIELGPSSIADDTMKDESHEQEIIQDDTDLTQDASGTRPWYKEPPEYNSWSEWQKFNWQSWLQGEIVRRGMYRP